MMFTYSLSVFSTLLVLLAQCCDCFLSKPFGSTQTRLFELQHRGNPTETFDDNYSNGHLSNVQNGQSVHTRRDLNNILFQSATTLVALLITSDEVQAETGSEILDAVKQAKVQLAPVPDLIKNEQWDSVRAILIKPPLSNCWTKSSKKTSLLQQYAETVATDELEALEIKEELEGHLRFLDMAVYNNVFNPIRTTGTIGATKELIRSYYEDPINEYKATIKFFDELIGLSSQ
jgi:hypothetical protein